MSLDRRRFVALTGAARAPMGTDGGTDWRGVRVLSRCKSRAMGRCGDR